MRKLFITLLVLGIASLASAGLYYYQSGNETEGYTLTIANDVVYTSSPTGQFQAMLVVDQPGSLTGEYSFGPAASAIAGYVPYLSTSVPASYVDVGGSELIDFSIMVVTDGTLNLLGTGDVISFGTNRYVSGGLYDFSGNLIFEYLTPEPTTICFLAAGGLLIRRRK